MHLSRRVWIQLLIFAVISVLAVGAIGLSYLKVPALLFGAGEYRVIVALPASGGLYRNGNVTYRGTGVGQVKDVRLTPAGVEAVLSLTSDVEIPSDVDAAVHSQTGLGEVFLELTPRSDRGPVLVDGDVIPMDRTRLPADINSLLTATNEGLQAIPNENLRTAIDESYLAVGGLGPELARIVKGTTALASDARANLESLTTLIDRSGPILDSQIDTADSIQRWATNVADVTEQLQSRDAEFREVLHTGPPALGEVQQLMDRFRPTLPILLNNLVSLADVAVVYQPNIEQLLVLAPPLVEAIGGSMLANRHTKQDYKGVYISFNLNLNLPPPCTTGFLPTSQIRPPSEEDYPQRPPGHLYCRVPQDSALNVRGVRNLPCANRPGKRAPTVAMCESDENYLPLNDGYNWKGDPNATLSGQAVPQVPAESVVDGPAVSPPLTVTRYDPSTGAYVGPDGKTYVQRNLARGAAPGTWQDMLIPPGG